MIDFSNLNKADDLIERARDLHETVKERVNLPTWIAQRPVDITQNVVYRLALLASLVDAKPRQLRATEDIRFKDHIHLSTFSLNNLVPTWSALLKLRWSDEEPDWESNGVRSRIVNWEILRGIKILSEPGVLDQWMQHSPGGSSSADASDIPELNLHIGEFEGGIRAYLDLNSRSVTNTQMLIAGSTGSGKSNLIALLIQELRSATVETHFPVNFLLFDYKGEFADPANADWLSLFSVNESAIFRPVESPLPFTPFKDFVGRPQGEVNLYASELSVALSAIDRASISAKMGHRLTHAVINAYGATGGRPIHFDDIERAYTDLQEKDTVDSVRAVLDNLIGANLFAREDRLDLIDNSLIIKMDDFPKDGPIAKALVYFVVSKLNTLYERLPKQKTSEKFVELRHFTIIDEAHYMLEFDNKPLRDLIAVGRNKGLSIILATQNMAAFKSSSFDYYANAQYPLLMKQQTIEDKTIKDLFGVSGGELQELREVIAGLGKGEVLLKDNNAIILGIGKKWKKILLRRVI